MLHATDLMYGYFGEEVGKIKGEKATGEVK